MDKEGEEEIYQKAREPLEEDIRELKLETKRLQKESAERMERITELESLLQEKTAIQKRLEQEKADNEFISGIGAEVRQLVKSMKEKPVLYYGVLAHYHGYLEKEGKESG